MAKIEYFKDVALKPLPEKTGSIYGSTYLERVAAMQIGAGSKVFRADDSGIWLGAAKWADAPFRVDMLGNAVATSITVSGYILAGGAAADVNTGITAISPGKVLISGSTYLDDWSSGSDATYIDGGKLYTGSVTTSQLNFTPLVSSGTTTAIIATINASAEGIDISADRISISGSTTFSAGYNPTSKVTTFAQDAIPTSVAAGDLWVDTNDNNKLYRAAAAGADQIVAGEWVAVPDDNKLSVLADTYQTAASGARVEIFPDANTGIVAYDNAGTPAKVFEVLVAGADVGDVTIGDYAGSKGVKWDKSAGTFDIRGYLTASDMHTGGIVGVNMSLGSDFVKLDGANKRILINDGSVSTVSITSGGTGYTVGDDLTLVEAGASGATVNVDTVAGGVVTGVTILTRGTTYTTGTKATTGGTGADCTINITATFDRILIGYDSAGF